MRENRMCIYMCNWVTMLYSRNKNVLGKLQLKKKEAEKKWWEERHKSYVQA